ncbi:MAG: hypothetical protein ACKO6N_13920 [Myxococcota bacterium]
MSLSPASSSPRCPGCQRPIVGKRPRCLYCGASWEGLMPEPSGGASEPSSGSTRVAEAGPELDVLVRQALKTGNLEALKQSLGTPREASGASIPVKREEYSTPTPARRDGLEREVMSAPAPLKRGNPPVGLSRPSPLESVPVNVTRRSREPELVGRAPGGVEPVSLPLVGPLPVAGPLPMADPTLVEVERGWEPPPVMLPPFRHPFMLVVEGPANAELASPLARALGVDVATARLHCVGQVPKAVLRGPERAGLEEKARLVQRATGLRAVVVERERVLSLSSPWGVLAGLEEGTFRVLPLSHWVEEPPPEALAHVQVKALPDVRLLLVGEVAVGRFRPGMEQARLTRRREDPLVALHERRLMVVELHGEAMGFRLVEGMSDLRALPGFEAGASLRDLKRLVEALKVRWPNARHEGRCVAVPGEKPMAVVGGEAQVLERSGWPQWEEHARLCRLLWLQSI